MIVPQMATFARRVPSPRGLWFWWVPSPSRRSQVLEDKTPVFESGI